LRKKENNHFSSPYNVDLLEFELFPAAPRLDLSPPLGENTPPKLKFPNALLMPKTVIFILVPAEV
jgi:hypothetical protein